MTNIEYTIIKKHKSHAPCSNCNGTGKKERAFRDRKFVYNCPVCKGEGNLVFIVTEEFPLVEALNDILN